jgi:hypothetical protein
MTHLSLEFANSDLKSADFNFESSKPTLIFELRSVFPSHAIAGGALA